MKFVDSGLFLGLKDYVFIILCFLVPIYNFQIPLISTIGFLSIIIILLSGIYIFFNKIKDINKFSLIIFFLLTLYNLFLLGVNVNLNALYYFCMQTSLFTFILALTSLSVSKSVILKISNVMSVLYYIGIVLFLFFFIFGNWFDLLWILTVCFALQYFVMLKSSNPIFVVLLSTSVFLIAQERTSAIVTLLIFGLYKSLLLKRRKLLSVLFFTLTTFMLLFPFIYTILALSSGSSSNFNNYIFELTGKNFFSGRQAIWGVVIENFLNSPVWGYGLGNDILISNGIEVSTHNLYLFLVLQGGVISVLLFVMFMYSLWKQYYNYTEDKVVRLSMSYFVGIIISAGFGLILLANFLVYSIFLWIIIGFGIIVCNNLKSSPNEENV